MNSTRHESHDLGNINAEIMEEAAKRLRLYAKVASAGPAMVEKAAQAIHDHWQNGGRTWAVTCEKFPPQAEDFRNKARAALEACANAPRDEISLTIR